MHGTHVFKMPFSERIKWFLHDIMYVQSMEMYGKGAATDLITGATEGDGEVGHD